MRKPWTLFGVETEEEQQVFCRGMRTHVVTSHLAADLLSPIDGSLLSIEEDHVAYNDSISGPDQPSWPRAVFDWEEDDGDSPDFLRTDSSSDNLKKLVAPDEDMVLVSRSIKGFEGHEETLSSIKRRKEAFLDGTAWPEDANFVGIELRGEPKVLLTGEELHNEDRRWLLRGASRLLPAAYWSMRFKSKLIAAPSFCSP